MNFIALALAIDFQPYMIDHLYEGCPENSTCTKELGQKVSAFKKGNRSEIPFALYIRPNFKGEAISWDNPLMKNRSFSPAYQFLSQRIIEQSETILRKALVSKGQKFVNYFVPRNSDPLFLNNELLYFSNQFEDVYFGMTISPEGKIKSVPIAQSYPLPESIECPENLITKMQEKKELPFERQECQKIWDIRKKKFFTIILERESEY